MRIKAEAIMNPEPIVGTVKHGPNSKPLAAGPAISGPVMMDAVHPAQSPGLGASLLDVTPGENLQESMHKAHDLDRARVLALLDMDAE